MTDYLNIEAWRGRRQSEMADLEFSRADSIFIFTRAEFSDNLGNQECRVLFADTLSEAAGYFAHVFLRDLAFDAIDDQRFDFCGNRQKHTKDTLDIGVTRLSALKAMKSPSPQKEFIEVVEKFNETYSCAKGGEYEFRILIGADELRRFLTKRYSESEFFSNERLEKICSAKSFDGGELLNHLKFLLRE